MNKNRFSSVGTAMRNHTHWLLMGYDCVAFLICSFAFALAIYNGQNISFFKLLLDRLISLAVILLVRMHFGIYKIVWRYGGVSSYLRLITSDALAGLIGYLMHFACYYLLPKANLYFMFSRTVTICAAHLLVCLSMRMVYRYIYKTIIPKPKHSRFIDFILKFVGTSVTEEDAENDSNNQKVTVAIYGAGRVGVSLFSEMLSNPSSIYRPVCFIDSNPAMSGRNISNLPVVSNQAATQKYLQSLHVQEVVIASATLTREGREITARVYEDMGFPVKYYDMPLMKDPKGKMITPSFRTEDLLFRSQISMLSSETVAYYRGKTVLITGGGGSIGSELCRQLAAMNPERIIVLDVYENGAYEVQQELHLKYGAELKLQVEICSICNEAALRRVFEQYHPQIVVHAAAHKHVPLMEKNCIEAVENNVFGTLNVVRLCEEYGVEHFLMVSTDKAVNPTNIMGATKRMCEMIVMAHAGLGKTVFTATRFGNVLGSAGSVIPLFRKQIENGGPVTVTHRDIIRYFMTIPEASQLVLTSGALAKNGELFVLDMGAPVRIYQLAETMIKMYGLVPGTDIEIRETGLRPGEKMYEELLVKGENTESTKNNRIFIEREEKPELQAVEEKLIVLRRAMAQSDEAVRKALHEVVPTFKTPEEVNGREAGAARMDDKA